MKINFKKPLNNKDVLFININFDNKDEIFKENNIKTLYLKCEEKMTLRKLFLIIRKMIMLAKKNKADKIAFNFSDFIFDSIKISKNDLAEIIGTQLDFANYEFLEYKTETKNTFMGIKEVFILETTPEISKTILRGHHIAIEVNKARTLSNTPGADMTPTILANKAKESVLGLPVKVTILGEKEIKREKMHAILSVGGGSDEESKFIIMEYWGGSKKDKPIILVGKGVTFDTGGINLKPSSGLLSMNMDMSGGASVIHTLSLVAKMKLKKNVIAIIPSVENMASGKSYRPGDIIRSMSGKTIEILNTDAEGRVILADALTYTKRYKPEIVIDVATLTGAACVALGDYASAIFTEDDELSKTFEEIGERTGDYVWRLPLWEEYESGIKGSVGDLTNVHNKDSRSGGAIYAASFLHQFIKGTKWLHIDMAPRMVSASGDNLSSGALGTPVRMLFKFIEEN